MILSNISFGENVVVHPSTSINNVAFGNDVKIAKECTIHGSEEHVVKIGSGTIFGMYVTLDGTEADVKLGKNVSIAQHNVIVSNWGLAEKSAINVLFEKKSAPISIGDHSWIGSGCVIAPGVTIGKFCIVASNSYVDTDVPDYTIVGGNPARFIRKVELPELDVNS
ncbi:acyltransferase [Natronoflexus pectinivorans]|uniref:Succinyltransferase-like protein n=1 Tax=Natronoflexus pectinivorans TaxID=682526 RepID=A0A4R2GF61_9BACT|nr:acyltransferase [Natronoflexus pectinivorans]TCO06848.1 succinyltransferase-like protein [Natronoflexus pectinivorans]